MVPYEEIIEHKSTKARRSSFLFERELERCVSPDFLDFLAAYGNKCNCDYTVILRKAHDIYSDADEGIQSSQFCEAGRYSCIIGAEIINNILGLNPYLEAVNQKLEEGGVIIGFAETSKLRRQRLRNRIFRPLGVLYLAADHFIHRGMPKLPWIRSVYFDLTKGKNRNIPEMEIYGRLNSCGFHLLRSTEINGLFYFAAKKIEVPNYDPNLNYGLLIKLPRFGKNGKPIKVYKIRTMYPYSEYLQGYIYESHGLEDGGKIKDDVRITPAGKMLRKFWIDEIPMLINLVKGDLKLVGVRPLSSHFLSLYPKDFREYRQKFKPGLLPPFYVDLPHTLEEIINSEKRYLKAYEERPLLTDFRYLMRAISNILFKKVRSS